MTSAAPTELTLRPGEPTDADACGRICFEAFRSIADAHGFPPDFPSAEAATGLTTMLLSHPGFYSVVASRAGQVLASNFLDERSPIAGVGPLTVDPEFQDRGIGRRLMEDVVARATEKGFAGVRLLQAAYHNRSLSLYASMGFAVRDVFACMQGAPPGGTAAGYRVRPAAAGDLEACNTLCRAVHGHDRGGELCDAIGQGTAAVVEHDGRISGYASALAFFGHAVGESPEDIKALICAAQSFEGPGILVPLRSPLFSWCLSKGLRVVFVATLMTLGLYNEPTGAYMPSILY